MNNQVEVSMAAPQKVHYSELAVGTWFRPSNWSDKTPFLLKSSKGPVSPINGFGMPEDYWSEVTPAPRGSIITITTG